MTKASDISRIAGIVSPTFALSGVTEKDLGETWVTLFQKAPLTAEECLEWADKISKYIRFVFVAVTEFNSH